ncbi:MAG: hypothetical protein FJ148_05765 [Deltaproteobacteria bacterium]|nr:hypothetical protein [Deltaproteobacteria bacterium]
MKTPGEESAAALGEHRCVCGSLLARLRQEGVELKCRRCKRVVVVRWDSGARWHGVDVAWEPPDSED